MRRSVVTSWEVGLRPSTRRKANVSRASVSVPVSMLRAASTRAASAQVGSFKVVNACSGVLVVATRTLHVWRLEASNMFAGPMVRRQNV